MRAPWRGWGALALLCPLGTAAGERQLADGALGDALALLQSGPAAGAGGGGLEVEDDAGGFQHSWKDSRLQRAEHATRMWYHLHTPRTGGTSLYRDAKKIFKNPPPNHTAGAEHRMLSKEGCYNWKNKIKHINISAVAVMVREPRAHVFSQFLFCSEGSISEMTSVRNLTEWLLEWRRMQLEGKVVGDFTGDNGARNDILFQKYVTFTTLPFKCYNPINLQTHRLTCRYPFEYPEEAGTADLAIEHMQEATFVGITEAYQESVCALYGLVHGALPDFCDCRNQTAWSTFPGTHTAFHSIHANSSAELASQPAEVLAAIDALTAQDAKLYQAALERFRRDVRSVEVQHKTKLSCNEQIFPKADASGIRPPKTAGPRPQAKVVASPTKGAAHPAKHAR